MPTWVHGLLQHKIMDLLNEAGLISALEVELRIEPDAHPKPDVVATTKLPNGPYPTEGLDVVVEIISEDNGYQRVKRIAENIRSGDSVTYTSWIRALDP
ncbi:MAG: hypothetical protein M3Y72_04615 [Acidobacteriota bacterium]|nr:hypothetical protein [Acidobacteriota bacterium]